jgi:hypothetical protein
MSIRRRRSGAPTSERAAAVKAREEHRDAIEGLTATYVRLTADPEAGAAMRDYVGGCEPRLDAETLRDMRRALEVAASPDGNYVALPDMVRNRCVLMCFELDARGDSRLLDIIDRAEARAGAGLTTGSGEGSRGAAGRKTIEAGADNMPAAAGAGQAATAERDQYLAEMLAAHGPESKPFNEGPEREVASEPSQTHGRSRKKYLKEHWPDGGWLGGERKFPGDWRSQSVTSSFWRQSRSGGKKTEDGLCRPIPHVGRCDCDID